MTERKDTTYRRDRKKNTVYLAGINNTISGKGFQRKTYLGTLNPIISEI